MLTKHLFLFCFAATIPFVSALPPHRSRHDSAVHSDNNYPTATTSSDASVPSNTAGNTPNSTSATTSSDAPVPSKSVVNTPNPTSATTSATTSSDASVPSKTTGNTPNPTSANSEAVIAAWYPGWLSATYPPESLSWSKYNTMTFSFAVPSIDASGVSVLTIDDKSQAALPGFVSQANNHGVKALVSIGGWAGSTHFSTIMATANGRTSFIKAILALVSQHSLDGIDFDWEYPGKQGDSSNEVSPNDSDNFLLFLQELRKDAVGSKLILSAAVGMAPFIGTDGQPKSDVSGFASVFDFIAIMAYDVWGSWSPSVGPNAPLYDLCSPKAVGSADTAIKAWTGAKFPANQIVLGLASYGRGYTVSTAQASNIGNFPSSDASLIPAGDEDTSSTASSANSGLFNFNALVKNGYLDGNGKAAEGVVYKYDECSQTPYLYNGNTQTMISYDDAASFGSKSKYVKDNGLKGVAMWNGVGDYNDILLNSVRSVLSTNV